MSSLTDLADQWRELADHERDLGAEAQARTLEWCADRLEGLPPSRQGGNS